MQVMNQSSPDAVCVAKLHRHVQRQLHCSTFTYKDRWFIFGLLIWLNETHQRLTENDPT